MSQAILLVEDNKDDIFAMTRALKRAKITCPLQIVANGQQALEYLAGKGHYSDRGTFPLPFIVFLDLKLPFIDGFEVLKWLSQQPDLKQIAVVVLTSSAEQKDRERARALGAQTCLVKPPTPEMLSEVMASLGFPLSNIETVSVAVTPR